MLYREFAPSSELKPYVKCYWSLDAPSQAVNSPERIVPDGQMELIFHYGSQFEKLRSNEVTLQSRSLITGQIREPLFLRPTGSIGIFAARFFPFGFSSLFLNSSNEIAGSILSCEEVFGNDGVELEDRILSAKDSAQRVQILDAHLLRLLNSRGDYDFRIHRIVRKIQRTGGIFRSEELAQEFNISSRQLERLFLCKVGISPKAFGRIIRFQKAIALKLGIRNLTLTELSHATGYYDQSHFIKDFKELSGLSPKQYFAEAHQMADFFTDDL